MRLNLVYQSSGLPADLVRIGLYRMHGKREHQEGEADDHSPSFLRSSCAVG